MGRRGPPIDVGWTDRDAMAFSISAAASLMISCSCRTYSPCSAQSASSAPARPTRNKQIVAKRETGIPYFPWPSIVPATLRAATRPPAIPAVRRAPGAQPQCELPLSQFFRSSMHNATHRLIGLTRNLSRSFRPIIAHLIAPPLCQLLVGRLWSSHSTMRRIVIERLSDLDPRDWIAVYYGDCRCSRHVGSVELEIPAVIARYSDLPVLRLGRRFRCSLCGHRPAETRCGWRMSAAAGVGWVTPAEGSSEAR